MASWQLIFLASRDDSGGRIRPDVLAGLPSLQRGAVWKPNQIELLWDSILRGFPIGALVACRRLPAAQQHTRSGAVAADRGDGLPWPEDQYTHHLLDGQQRANAVALGYLDPYAVLEEKFSPKTILWLDLDPSNLKNRFPATSTRNYLLRVTTEAHPWGFAISDDKDPVRLSSGEAYDAIASFRRVHPLPMDSTNSEDAQPEQAYSSRKRPSPCEGWPIVAGAPLPLAWALLAADELAKDAQDASVDAAWAHKLWTKVLKRVDEVRIRGRVCGAIDSAEGSELTPAGSAAETASAWWIKVCQVLTNWIANTASEPESQSIRLAKALRRAVDARMVVLSVPQDALDAPSRLESIDESRQNQTENIANLEHLFARLNNGGTSLSADDMSYSMIKAYWPGIERTIEGIRKRPPETQVALLGARLARAEAVWRAVGASAPTLPAAPNVAAIRQLGAVRRQSVAAAEGPADQQRAQQLERQAWREHMETVFGLGSVEGEPPNASDTPIALALTRVDDWFGYSAQQRWGLPPVLLSRMATQSSELYLFLLWLAHHHGTAPMPGEDVRRPLLGLATAIQWFGTNSERAVRELWMTAPRDWLNGDAFKKQKWLKVLGNLQNAKQQPDPAVPFIPTPDELALYIDERTLTKDDSIEDWRWWDTLVVAATRNEWEKTHPGQEPNRQTLDEARDLHWGKWSGVIKVLSAGGYGGANALLLMYAQREQMHHFFSTVDTRDTGFWDNHNVPWDFDHLLQQSLLSYRRTGKYQWAYQAWGYTIANLHLLPFGLNRARGDMPLTEALSEWTQDDWQRALLWDKTGRQDFFSLRAEDVKEENPDAIHTFAIESRARLLRIYGDWFNTLDVARLL